MNRPKPIPFDLLRISFDPNRLFFFNSKKPEMICNQNWRIEDATMRDVNF